ncbi:hypothetical protein BDW71DRAFT_101962 [Aspergillus fruticulosus]
MDGRRCPSGSTVPARRLPLASTRKIVPFDGSAETSRSFLCRRGDSATGIHLPTKYRDGAELPREYLEGLLQIPNDIDFLAPWQEG